MNTKVRPTRLTAADPQALLRAWLPFRQLIGVMSVRSDEDYRLARANIDALVDEIGEDESHPLAELLDLLATQAEAWEASEPQLPRGGPREVLRFLMAQHGLRQEDLGDCAPQSRISEILNGRRAISKNVAKALSRRFAVPAEVFI